MADNPCAFCGDPDAKHRIYDAIVSRRKAGETVTELAHDYGMKTSEIHIILVKSQCKRQEPS